MGNFDEKLERCFTPIQGVIETGNWFGSVPKRTARSLSRESVKIDEDKLDKIARKIAKPIIALNCPELSPRDKINIKKLIRGETVSRTTDPEKILKRLDNVIFEQRNEADFNPENITNRQNLKEHLQLRENLKLYIQWQEDVASGKFTAKRYFHSN